MSTANSAKGPSPCGWRVWNPHLILQVKGGFGDRMFHADLAPFLTLPQLRQLLLDVSHGDSVCTRDGPAPPPAQGPGPSSAEPRPSGMEEADGALSRSPPALSKGSKAPPVVEVGAQCAGLRGFYGVRPGTAQRRL